ncbi:transcriptional regulator [Escherichia coli]|uniref:Transcriptional regulator n=1 Tax=Escherichia coli TaxID=562 RepID=A0A1Q6BC46_ECOLX|nr:transcriptional regulator [Escherichia coli]OKV10211.1 transcriptional regulator [Escherichia coli]OKV24727.1 transcriptional regulator [Escherichia coli]OKV55477.1 transcriptional regulator [Escherichia coli]OKW05437.1 transcriptional regulator [Escherichia coli]
MPHRLTFLPAGEGIHATSGSIIPRIVGYLTLSLRPGKHLKIAHTLIGKQSF